MIKQAKKQPEFMTTVPEAVMVGDKYIADDDTIFTMSIKDLLMILENSSEFYKNRNAETARKVMYDYIEEQSKVLLDDAGYYVNNVMQKFLAKEFKK
jgi:hypothetical protein